MIVRPLSTVNNTRDYTLVYPTVDSGLTITCSAGVNWIVLQSRLSCIDRRRRSTLFDRSRLI